MHVRVARHTNRLTEIVRFYRDGLGLREIGHFYSSRTRDPFRTPHFPRRGVAPRVMAPASQP
jgi:YycE-like N-terminal domain